MVITLGVVRGGQAIRPGRLGVKGRWERDGAGNHGDGGVGCIGDGCAAVLASALTLIPRRGGMRRDDYHGVLNET